MDTVFSLSPKGRRECAAEQPLLLRELHALLRMVGVEPTTALTRPSRCQPMAIFSEVASAWKSTTTGPPRGMRFSSASMQWNGQSAGGRKTRPSRLTTVSGPRAVCTVVHP